MEKNLLVNAFTKILEFKRKHNKLVKEVEEIPNTILGDLETKDLKVKTVSQSEANYTFLFEVNVEDTTNFEKVGNQYCKMEIVNGELHIIILAQFKNIDTVNQHSTRLAQFNIENIPAEISSKIYGYNGITISERDAGIVRIAPIGISANVDSLDSIRILSSTPNTLNFYQPSAKIVSPESNITFSMEVNLSLL